MCLFVLIYIIIIIINYAYTCNYFKRVVLINFNAHNDLHTILTVPFLHTHIFFHNCSSRHHYHRTTHYHCIPRPYTLSLHTSYITPTPLLHHSYTTPTPHSYTTPTPLLHHSYTTPTPHLYTAPTPLPTPTPHLYTAHIPLPTPTPLLHPTPTPLLPTGGLLYTATGPLLPRPLGSVCVQHRRAALQCW